MTKFFSLCLACMTLLTIFGCSQHSEYGEKKEDWAKSPPPKNWRGPGQPGGPVSGPMTTPPANTAKPGS